MRYLLIIILVLYIHTTTAQSYRYALNEYRIASHHWSISGYSLDTITVGFKLNPLPAITTIRNSVDSLCISMNYIMYDKADSILKIKGIIETKEKWNGCGRQTLILAGQKRNPATNMMFIDTENNYPNTSYNSVEIHNYFLCFTNDNSTQTQQRSFDCKIKIKDNFDMLIIGINNSVCEVYDLKKILKVFGK